MPRDRSPNRDKAYEIYKERKGDVTNREISAILGEDEKKVAVWKQRDKWNVVQQSKKRCTTKQKKAEKAKANREIERVVESVMENEDLTDKQRLFCIYYLKNFNATQAAIRAGYSPNTAMEQGYQLMHKTSVRAEIEKLKLMRSQSIMVSEDDIIERYMKIAFADMTDFADFNGMMVTAKHSDTVDGGLICQVKSGQYGVTIKLEDRQKALEWLANYFDMNQMNKHRREYDNKRLDLERERIELERLRNKDYGITDDEEQTGVVLLPEIDESLIGESDE